MVQTRPCYWGSSRAWALGLLLLLFAFPLALVQAATVVSGPIAVNTAWLASQSPYQLTSDVTLENNAILTLEPGVVVYLNSGVNLIVASGSLKATASAANPITITSSRDRTSQTPAPGDWGQLRFLDGSSDSGTQLDHVHVKFGSGIRIQSASPRFDHLTVTGHTGAAITIDLNSSPAGQGNQASGNDINGVSVPAGDILGNLTFGLQGIPYVVAQGILSVGRSPVISSINPGIIEQGETLDATILGTRLSGAEQIVFADPGITATIRPGATDSLLPVTLSAGAATPLGRLAFEVQVAAGKPSFAAGIEVITPKPRITVTGISPTSQRRGETRTFTITGANLAGARVTSSSSGLVVSNAQSSANQITLNLTASTSVVLGVQRLTFNNDPVTSGSPFAELTVQKALPRILITPAPLAVPPDSALRQFSVRLSEADDVEHSISLSVIDSSVANVSPASVTIPAGQTQAIARISGLRNGQTTLTASSATLGNSTVPIFVTPEFSGINTSNAALLGVILEQNPPPNPGVTVDGLASPHVGVVLGNHIQGIDPAALAVGTGPTFIVITGAGLEAADTVTLVPADGVTLGSISASADGLSLSLPVTVATNAPTTLRQLVVSAAGVRYPASHPGADRLLITPPKPEIIAIEPLFATVGNSSVAFTVRGRNLQGALGIQFSPGAGITSGALPAVNAEGTELTTTLAVSSTAAVGQRIVTVTTPGGVSAAAPAPANTFTVVNEIRNIITPIAAALLGVVKQDATPPAPQIFGLFSNVLGVSLGSVISSVSPSARAIGETFMLNVQGSDLQGVTSVQFTPVTGISVAAPVIAADGKSLVAEITLALDAPRTLRSLAVIAGTAAIPFADPASALFRVTSPQPAIDSVSPIAIPIGAAPLALRVGGVNFQNASQVRVTPSNDLSISTPPTISADGTEVIINISAAASAAPGQRVVSVVTPAGETSGVSTTANTITFSNNLGPTYSPLSAPLLGIVKQQEPVAPVARDVGPFISPTLGVVLIDAAPPPGIPLFIVGPQLGVALGPTPQRIEPAAFAPAASGVLTIKGHALNGVTGITIKPADGVTLGTLAISPDGLEISVPITVAANAPPTVREVIVSTASGRLAFSDPGADRLTIGPGTPQIISISPILARQGETVTLTVRGSRLQGATGATATPADGASIGVNPVVNSDGTELTVSVSVAANATPGSRVIRVLVPGAASTADASSANTFTVFVQ